MRSHTYRVTLRACSLDFDLVVRVFSPEADNCRDRWLLVTSPSSLAS